MAAEEPLLEVRASWWNFFWYLLFFWLIVPFVIAWWKRLGMVLRVYEDRLAIERGVWAKEVAEYFIEDIRSIEVRQSVLQRMTGIGDLEIGTAASEEDDEEIRGVPDPMGIKDLITSKRQQST